MAAGRLGTVDRSGAGANGERVESLVRKSTG